MKEEIIDNKMNDERLEKINFITGVFSACLWGGEENELDELYKQAKDFHNKRVEETKEFAKKLIDKFLSRDKVEKLANPLLEERINTLESEVRDILTRINFDEYQKIQIAALKRHY